MIKMEMETNKKILLEYMIFICYEKRDGELEWKLTLFTNSFRFRPFLISPEKNSVFFFFSFSFSFSFFHTSVSSVSEVCLTRTTFLYLQTQ